MIANGDADERHEALEKIGESGSAPNSPSGDDVSEAPTGVHHVELGNDVLKITAQWTHRELSDAKPYRRIADQRPDEKPR